MSPYTQQQIIDAVLGNEGFNHCLNARLLDTRQNPYSPHGVMKIVHTQMTLALYRAEETLEKLGLNCTELEKTDTFFHATVQFIRAWKEFRQAFSKSTVNRASLMPELNDAGEYVSSAVKVVDHVLANVVSHEKGSSILSTDRLLAILSDACHQSVDNSWSNKERWIYKVASQTFNVVTEVWAVIIERVLREVERLLPAVRQEAMERKLHLTEGWLLVYTVCFLFPSVSYAGEDQEKGTVLPVITDEFADEFRQTLNERIDLSSAFSIGNELFQAVSSLMEQVRQPNVDEDALLDVCYSFCHGIMAERFRKEQEVAEAAAQVFRRHNLSTQDDINSTVVASNVFAEALQCVYNETKALPAEKVLEVIFDECFVPKERQAHQERKARLDSYATEWEEIAVCVAHAVRPYLGLYNGSLSRYRENFDEAFQKVYLWIKEAFQAASQRAEELQLILPTDRLVSLTITSLR
jgi:hypothetical protein